MSYSDVTSFLGVFDGGARPNRYKVTIDSSPKHAPNNPGAKFTFLCKASSIPASTLSPCIVAYMGRDIKVPGDRTFDDWSVTVYNTKDFALRKYFENWSSNILRNWENITTGEDENDYQNQATVYQLDRGEKPINTYYIKGIFPTSIGEITLAYDNNNTVEEFTVTFAVNYWTSDATDFDGGVAGD